MADENDTPLIADTGVEDNQPLGVDEGVDDLKTKLAAAEARAAAAEARANAAVGQVDQAHDEVQRSNLTVINGAIEQLTTAKETLKAQYAQAMAEGDFARAAEVNSAMVDTATKLTSLENGKVAIETAPKREARRAAATSGDPVESRLAEWGLSPKSADWVRRHPEYARDPRKTQRMLAAHNMVMTEDQAPELESPEYFAAIEKRLDIGYSDQRRERSDDVIVKVEEPLSGAAAPARKRDAAPPAAPASRGNSNGPTRRLSREQAEAARIAGVTNEVYAAQLDRIAKDKVN